MPARHPASLPRRERLGSGAALDRLFRSGMRVQQPSFTLLWLEGTDGPRRAAFAAGRRVGGSVVRNRARRRLREAYRAQKGRVAVGVHLCLIARRGADVAPFPELTGQVVEALGRTTGASRT
jgi:ribonuclease P protein component